MIPPYTNKECNSQTLSKIGLVVQYTTEISSSLIFQNIRTLIMKNYCLAYYDDNFSNDLMKFGEILALVIPISMH